MTTFQAQLPWPAPATYAGDKRRTCKLKEASEYRALHSRVSLEFFRNTGIKCRCSRERDEESPTNPGYGILQNSVQTQTATKANLLAKINTTLHTRDLLKPHEKVLVAVSGGQDSIALIFALKELQQAWGWKLGIVHCDHQWSSSSRSQASHVSQIASYLGIDFHLAVATWDVKGESAGRKWRYDILQRIARSHGYSAIVTAHTGSDRVETLLHNLFRGTGLHGLQSLTWKRWMHSSPSIRAISRSKKESYVDFIETCTEGQKLPAPHDVALVRPVLDISRTELRQFCDIEKLPLWPDPSNFSIDIRRNRIRHQLLPFLREKFQATIDRSLSRWAEIICGEDDFLEHLSKSILKQAESSYVDGQGQVRMLKAGFIRTLHVALQRRVIKQFVEAYSNRSLGFDRVEHLRVSCLVQTCKDGTCFSLPGNVELQYLNDNFLLRDDRRR